MGVVGLGAASVEAGRAEAATAAEETVAEAPAAAKEAGTGVAAERVEAAMGEGRVVASRAEPVETMAVEGTGAEAVKVAVDSAAESWGGEATAGAVLAAVPTAEAALVLSRARRAVG